MTNGETPDRGFCWPTRRQEQLLRAALLDGPEAIAAWEAWSASVPDLGALDAGSVRTLPLLYVNLRRLGVSHPRLPMMRGTYRKAWYQNRLLLHGLEHALRALRLAGVRAMVLKGAALVGTAYRDLATRPMNDVDVLVRPAEAERACRVLAAAGYRTYRPGDALTPKRLGVGCSIALLDPRDGMLDLHWHAISDGTPASSEEPFWEGAVPTRVGDEETLAFEPSDQLLHVCVHGARWNPTPPFRWVADARAILSTGRVEPVRLVKAAERLALVVHLREALGYLHSVFPDRVVSEALARLAAVDVPGWQQRERRLHLRAPGAPSKALLQWYRHRRLSAGVGWVARTASFPSYVRDFYRLESLRELPRYLFLEAPRRRSTAPSPIAVPASR